MKDKQTYEQRTSLDTAIYSTMPEILRPTGVRREKFRPYDFNAAASDFIRAGRSLGDGFVIDRQNEFVLHNLLRWAHADPDFKCIDPVSRRQVKGRLGKGIYISGPTGTGKSWAMSALARYCGWKMLRVAFGDSVDFLAWRNINVARLCSAYSENGSLDCMDMRILGIEDLGIEPRESVYMGSRLNVMSTLIADRGDRSDRLTFITSNIPMSEIAKEYDERVASRLRQMCNYFELTGKDRRQ